MVSEALVVAAQIYAALDCVAFKYYLGNPLCLVLGAENKRQTEESPRAYSSRASAFHQASIREQNPIDPAEIFAQQEEIEGTANPLRLGKIFRARPSVSG